MRTLRRHPIHRIAASPFLVLWLAAGSLVSGMAASPIAAQSKKATTVPQYIFLLPEGFKGWVCVDFDIRGAAPLPREGAKIVIRPRPGEVLSTSDQAVAPELYGETWTEVDGKQQPLPENVMLQPGVSRIGPNEHTQRECSFVGTRDEKEAAADSAPGFENLSQPQQHIPAEERKALESLYKSTDGDHWMHHKGWLGPEGTECTWQGILCASAGHPDHVTHLMLADNNLSGILPEDLALLTQLEEVNVVGNHVLGKLPDPLIKRWLSGSLWINADPSAFTDVLEVDYESGSSSVLCASDRLVLRADGTAKLFTEKCRNKIPQDRSTYCEVKEGTVFGETFGSLATLLERNRFYSLRRRYFRSVTDSSFTSLRVVRGQKTYEVEEYAGGSPYEFWAIAGFIVGLENTGDWEKTTSIPKCPRWEKGRIP